MPSIHVVDLTPAGIQFGRIYVLHKWRIDVCVAVVLGIDWIRRRLRRRRWNLDGSNLGGGGSSSGIGGLGLGGGGWRCSRGRGRCLVLLGGSGVRMIGAEVDYVCCGVLLIRRM